MATRVEAPPSARIADVEVAGIVKRYGEVVAVAGVDLEIAAGEFFTLLGPSGSGKTTTLRMIAGFERPDAGRIRLRERDVTHLPPNARDVNTVFQDYALFPHMSVADNVAYGLKVKRVPRGERAAASTRCSRWCACRASATASRSSSPAGSGSGSRSRGRSSTGRRCCSSTSRSARST